MSNYGLTPPTPADSAGPTSTSPHSHVPFGYGLSYTSFSYSAATVDHTSTTADGTVNSAHRHQHREHVSATVAQLYRDAVHLSGVQLPQRPERLPEDQRASPRASQQITIPVKLSDLACGTRPP